LSERAGGGFEPVAVIGGKPAPGLEMSIFRTRFVEIDQSKVRTSKSRAFFSQNGSDFCGMREHQRIERAGMLPARSSRFRKERSLGFAEL
jgi:hypothetical protein